MANPEHVKIFYSGPDAWNEWRRGEMPVTPDLTRHDFSRMCLNLFDLSGALLSGANLEACHLNGTRLIEADLRGANLKGASLEEADFTRATFGYTTLADVSLVGVKGLGSVRHVTFSPVDTATLHLTATFLKSGASDQQAAEIELFLRSAGVPNDLLGLFRSWAGRDDRYVSCFISYSHSDKPFAERLWDALAARGVTCWLDSKDMFPGDHLHDTVDQAFRQLDKVLLCCSQRSLTSWWVDSELDRALEKERELSAGGVMRRLLIPLDLDGYLFNPEWKGGKAALLRSRKANDFVGWAEQPEKFRQAVDRLLAALRRREDG